MRHRTLKRSVLFAAIVFVVLARGHCQPAGPWREFNVAAGFPESSFRSVTIADSGAVLAVSANSSSAWVFDGYESKSIPLPDGAERIYQSPAGQFWTTTTRGLWAKSNQDWQLHVVPGFANAPAASQIPLCPVRLNVVLYMLPGQLIECSIEDSGHLRSQTLRDAAGSKIGRFCSMVNGVEDELWILGERGLGCLTGPKRSLAASNEWREFIPPESLHLQHLRHPQPDESGVTLVADSSADGQSCLVRFDGERWRAQAVGVPQLSFAWRGPDDSFWAASSNQLFHDNGAGLVVVAEPSPRQYNDVEMDWRGTFWLATSGGLVRFTPNLWRMAAADAPITAALQSLANDGHWPNLPGQITRFDADPAYTAPIASIQNVTGLKPIGLLKNGLMCCAAPPTKESNWRSRLETFDGTNFQTLPIFLPQAAVDSRLNCLLATQPGDIWIAGDFGTAYLRGRWTVFPAADSGSPESACHLVELPTGQIWCASPEKIWSFDGKHWSVVRGGFHHLNAMLAGRDGGVWVGDASGLARFINGHWIGYGLAEGLAVGPIEALGEDQYGGIWAAGRDNVRLFHPETDSDPPRTFIVPMSDELRRIPEDGEIDLKFKGRDKWDVSSPGRLYYDYRLDTGDWSPFATNQSVSFSDLPAGKHYFQVRAMDRAGNIDPDPAELDFAMVLPWYKESRLVLIASVGAAAAAFFAALAYRRHRQLVLSYAQVERQVAERTRELEVASEELLQSQKMRALGTLSASIAHDFNNILSIVKGSAQIIEDNPGDREKIRTRLDRIKTVVNQGSAVVQALLGFSRGSDEMVEDCDINPVVDNTLKLLGDRFLREVELQFDGARSLPRVRASQSLVQQILLNFIFNAAESMNGRKRVIITTSQSSRLPAQMALSPGAAADYVAVAVQDFGCGIAPENVTRVFEPFFTTKALSTRRGTGLGLSIVYELAKKMDAGLALESTVGEGSLFILFLPVHSGNGVHTTN